MDFESPDVEKEFPGLYASDGKKNQDRDSDYSDEEKVSKKELLAAIAKRKEKKDSKKDKGYVAFEGESSDDGATDDTRSPSKGKKSKSAFKFPLKEKKDKSFKIKDQSKKENEETKETKKETKESKKEHKENKKDKEHKKKKESKVRLGKLKKKHSLKEDKALFGVPLQLAVDRNKSHDGLELPAFFRECLDYIEEHGLACEGIYRISGVKSKVQQLRAKYDHGDPVYLYEHEPHTVASLLKHFLRELPEPVLTSELTPKFEEATSIKDEQKKLDTLNKLFTAMPACNRLLLTWMFVHMLHIISLEKRNKMSQQDVMITLGPVMQISHQVINTFYKYREQLFQRVEIKKYTPGLRTDVSRLSLELPDTPAGIEDELNRQEALLAKLHEELNSGVRDTQKEEQLWEVQRVVTQLKRKLRFLKQPSNKIANEGNAKELSSVTEEVIDTRLREAPEKDLEGRGEDVKDGGIEGSTEKEPTESNNEPIKKIPSTEQLDDKPAPIEESVQNAENKQEETAGSEIQSPTAITPLETNNVTEEPKIEEKLDPEREAMLFEERTLLLQQEELISLNQVLRRKISTERMEVERLKGEIESCHQINKYKQYSFDSSENSSSSDSSESEDEDEDLVKVLESLILQNQELEKKNADLNVQIHQEREACMDIKVQIKLLQHGVPAY